MDPQQAQPAPQQPEYDPAARVGNALTVTQPGERTVCEIKRHPIGLIGIYAATGILVIVMAVIAFVVLPHSISNGSAEAIVAVLFLIVTVFTMLFAFISTKVYWGNSWVLTTDSLTQIEQDSLFKRESSQLSLGNLEDVTAEQNGILPHMFNYGWIRVETASERGKFVFQYCPNPNYYAQQILSAREGFEQNRRGEDMQSPYRGEGSYASPPQAQMAPPQQPQPQEAPQPPTPQVPQGQAGDPGYGAFKPPTSAPTPPPDNNMENPTLGQADYPGETPDQGVNVNV